VSNLISEPSIQYKLLAWLGGTLTNAIRFRSFVGLSRSFVAVAALKQAKSMLYYLFL
jgi:hypothetical protein